MIRVIAVGKIKDRFIRELTEGYFVNCQKFIRIKVDEVKDGNNDEENERICRLISEKYTVALSEEGTEITSKELANLIKNKKDIEFVIGGPDGLSGDVKSKADQVISLSRMTFTHDMARLILSEQLYRCMMINNNRKYHREN